MRTSERPSARAWLVAGACALLAACGGGGSSDATTTATTASGGAGGTATALAAGSSAVALADKPQSYQEAARFLTQASFGPINSENARVYSLGYSGWLNNQFTLPATSHRAYWDAADAALKLVDVNASAGQDQVFESFWKQAVNSPDQLRQRTAFALSEIFVASLVDGTVGEYPRGMAAWLDMLGDKAFGNYRDLIEAVSLHPMMGLYLTHLHNQKADTRTGRVPDENYGREVMQLFSIGLVQLNEDGTPKLVGGKPVETYTPADIAGMAKVFTGFSWACPRTDAGCFFNGSSGTLTDPDRTVKSMIGYPQYHATDAKTFLGVTIPAQSPANPSASLKVALDTLAAHPNVGPFIGKQLIQRLVTSNPSPAYVAAVSRVWANNGAGVRGDLKAVISAILLHPEARTLSTTGGKVREPVLRLGAYLRAFPHKSDTGNWKVGNTDSSNSSLGQTPLRAPSVFNFYRPGYVAPGTRAATAGLVAPEMQLVHETTAAGWVNYMRDNLSSGVGQFNGTVGTTTFNRRDLQRDWSSEMSLAIQPFALVSTLADRLMYGTAPQPLISAVADAVGKITVPALNAAGTNLTQVNNAKRARVNAAMLLLLASPEFQVQK